MVRIVVTAGVIQGLPPLVVVVLFNFVVFNVALAIFNLIPVPPLDGSTLLFRFLPPQTAWRIRPFLAQYGMFLVIAHRAARGQRARISVIYGVTLLLVGA